MRRRGPGSPAVRTRVATGWLGAILYRGAHSGTSGNAKSSANIAPGFLNVNRPHTLPPALRVWQSPSESSRARTDPLGMQPAAKGELPIDVPRLMATIL